MITIIKRGNKIDKLRHEMYKKDDIINCKNNEINKLCEVNKHQSDIIDNLKKEIDSLKKVIDSQQKQINDIDKKYIGLRNEYNDFLDKVYNEYCK